MESTIARHITANRILFLLGIIAGVIVVYKAASLSFTHDESATYLILQDKSIWQIFTDKSAWESANNHILNSVLYKLSVGIFGHSDFAMRLPNVLAYFGTFIVAMSLLKTQITTPITKFLFFAILILNPFTLDFYSLCRGYGLSMFFHFAFLASMWNYLEKRRISTLYFAYAMLILASLSLLTSLILFPIYTIAFWFVIFSQKPNNQQKKHIILVPVISGLFTLALVIKPIFFLMGRDEFKFGVSSIWDSFKSIILSSFDFVSRENYMWVFDVMTVLFMLSLTYVLFVSFKKRRNKYFSISMILLIVVLHLLLFGFGIMFPVDRKVTIYIPLLAVLFANHLDTVLLFEGRRALGLIIASVASLLIVASNQLDRTTEWAYDRKTKDFIFQIHAENKNEPKLLLAEWWFNPTAEYYIKSQNLKNIVLLPYDKNFDLSSSPDLVIAYKEQMNNNAYKLINSEGEVGLYQKK